MPDPAITVVEPEPKTKYRKTRGAAPIDLSKLPKDPGERQEYLRAEAAEALAMSVATAKRLAQEVASRDLSGESINKVMLALKTVTGHLADVNAMLAETTPRTINLTVQHGMPSRNGHCVYCGTKQEDKDATGFDPPEDEE